MEAVLPTGDLVVSSTDPTAGGAITYRLIVRGQKVGDGLVTTEMLTPAVGGVTVVETPLTVER